MFFSSPSADLTLLYWLLGFALVFSLAFFWYFKKALFSIFVFSVLANLIFYLDRGSELLAIYDMKWVVVFSEIYWPIFNVIFLIFLIVKNRLKR